MELTKIINLLTVHPTPFPTTRQTKAIQMTQARHVTTWMSISCIIIRTEVLSLQYRKKNVTTWMSVTCVIRKTEILSFTYILNVLASHHFLSTHNQSLGTIPIINKPGGCNALTSKYFNLLYTEPKHMIALNFLLQLNMTWLVIPNCRAFCTVSAVLEDVYRL